MRYMNGQKKDGVKVNKEAYKKATRLNDDIQLINYHLSKAKEDKTWITISTPFRKDEVLSSRFQRELIEWLEKKMAEYQKEFDEL